MSRRNTSRYAILGLLALRPMSGYDIRKAYEQSVGYFWSESYGQIYPILRRLLVEKLATRTVGKQEGKPDRHAYTITKTGREELRRWLSEPAGERKERSEVLLKLFFGSHLPVAETIRHIRRVREEHSQRLERYGEIEERLHSEYAANPQSLYWLLTVKCGMALSKASLDWCDEAVSLLEKKGKGGRK